MATLLGLNEAPGELTGYGPITAQYARELAENATWRRILTDPAGEILEVGRRYPAAAFADHVRLRDRTCLMPGCNTPAPRCHLDHVTSKGDERYTSASDCGCICGYHRKLMPGNWTLTQINPGRFTWTTPAGRTHHVTPEPYEEPAA